MSTKSTKSSIRPGSGSKGEEKPGPVEAGLPTVNLLSPWAFERIAVRALRTRFVLGCVALTVAAGAVWGVQAMRVADADALLVVENTETSQLSKETAVLQPVKTYIAGVEQQKSTVAAAMASEIHFSEVLESLTDAVPAGVVLGSVSVTPAASAAPPTAPVDETPAAGGATPAPAVKAVPSPCPGPDPFQTRRVVGCITLSGNAGSRAEVGAFVIALGADDWFVEPFISTTTAADSAKVTFSGSVGLSEKVFSLRYAKLAQPAGKS